MSILRRTAACLLVACAFIAPSAFAQDGRATNGTYMLDDGSYTITVAMDGANLVVDEPGGKQSVYTPTGGGVYAYHNDNTGSDFTLTVVDARTLDAARVGNAAPSRLTLVGGGNPVASEAPADASKWEELANKYSELSQSDPANTQSWVACAAVAMKRSVSTQSEADAYASQMAGMLKQMDAASTPCEDVIPSSLW